MHRAVAVAMFALATWGVACAEDGDAHDFDEAGHPTSSVPRATGPLRFQRACEPGSRVTVAAVGDLLLQRPLQEQALSSPEGHASFWATLRELLQRADVTYANVDGTSAAGLAGPGEPSADPGPHYDGVVYTEYPRFNYHHSFFDDLARAGVDVLSTANNHAMDRGAAGVGLTLDAARAAGLSTTGTRAPPAMDAPWETVTPGPHPVAWLACATSLNGWSDPQHQVLRCDEDADELEQRVRELSSWAAVVVLPHGGVQYSHEPTTEQRAFARRMLDAGALAVLGSHPHVLQPFELHQTPDGRETLIAYSLGNFLSGQERLSRRASAVVQLGLTFGADGRAWLNGVTWVPVYVQRGASYRVVPTDSVADPEAASAGELVSAILGPWNTRPSGAPLSTSPECE